MPSAVISLIASGSSDTIASETPTKADLTAREAIKSYFGAKFALPRPSEPASKEATPGLVTSGTATPRMPTPAVEPEVEMMNGDKIAVDVVDSAEIQNSAEAGIVKAVEADKDIEMSG